MDLKPHSRSGYKGYLAVEGPEPIFEALPPVDFNRLMLTPIPAGVPEAVPSEKEEASASKSKKHDPRKAVERREDRITHVESTAGGE